MHLPECMLLALRGVLANDARWVKLGAGHAESDDHLEKERQLWRTQILENLSMCVIIIREVTCVPPAPLRGSTYFLAAVGCFGTC